MKKTICLDFDGVCNTYTGWKGEDELFQPRQGLEDFIKTLFATGFHVAVHSTRPSTSLYTWFSKYLPRIAEDPRFSCPGGKPPAVCYIDDRGITFTGSFDDILPKVLDFKPFWES